MPEDMREDIQRLRKEAMTAVRTRNPVHITMSEMISRVSGDQDADNADEMSEGGVDETDYIGETAAATDAEASAPDDEVESTSL